MKRNILIVLFIFSLSFASAQTSPSCFDLKINLSRGAESGNVLKLQNFLFAKGFLKATPNGYFGPGTLAGVKAFQKSVGLPQVGNTGPMTRMAIKKASCDANTLETKPVTPNVSTTTTPVNQVPVATTSSVTVVQKVYPVPALYSVDFITLFSGGQTDWTFNLYGMNFSQATNTIKFKNTATQITYTIGVLPSATGTVIIMPKNLTGTTFSCGVGCNEKLPSGTYEITVTTEGGVSNSRTIDIKSFTSSVQTGSVSGALPPNSSRARFGTLTFSPSVPVLVKSVTLKIVSSSNQTSGLGSTVLIDQATNAVLETNSYVPAYQSKIIDALADVGVSLPGTVTANFSVTLQDYVGKKDTIFTSPNFLVTLQGVL